MCIRDRINRRRLREVEEVISCRCNMVNGIFQPPAPHNEPVKGYLRGSDERIELEAELARQMSEVIEIPCIINGEEVWTNNVVEQALPHNHGSHTRKSPPGRRRGSS